MLLNRCCCASIVGPLPTTPAQPRPLTGCDGSAPPVSSYSAVPAIPLTCCVRGFTVLPVGPRLYPYPFSAGVCSSKTQRVPALSQNGTTNLVRSGSVGTCTAGTSPGMPVKNSPTYEIACVNGVLEPVSATIQSPCGPIGKLFNRAYRPCAPPCSNTQVGAFPCLPPAGQQQSGMIVTQLRNYLFLAAGIVILLWLIPATLTRRMLT